MIDRRLLVLIGRLKRTNLALLCPHILSGLDEPQLAFSFFGAKIIKNLILESPFGRRDVFQFVVQLLRNILGDRVAEVVIPGAILRTLWNLVCVGPVEVSDLVPEHLQPFLFIPGFVVFLGSVVLRHLGIERALHLDLFPSRLLVLLT